MRLLEHVNNEFYNPKKSRDATPPRDIRLKEPSKDCSEDELRQYVATVKSRINENRVLTRANTDAVTHALLMNEVHYAQFTGRIDEQGNRLRLHYWQQAINLDNIVCCLSGRDCGKSTTLKLNLEQRAVNYRTGSLLVSGNQEMRVKDIWIDTVQKTIPESMMYPADGVSTTPLVSWAQHWIPKTPGSASATDPFHQFFKSGFKLYGRSAGEQSSHRVESPHVHALLIDECLPGDSLVTLANGSRLPIKEIIDSKLPVEVLSYNEVTGCVEPKPVTGWRRVPRRGRSILKLGELEATEDHPVYTKEHGYLSMRECQELAAQVPITVLWCSYATQEYTQEVVQPAGHADRARTFDRPGFAAWRRVRYSPERGEWQLASPVYSGFGAAELPDLEVRRAEEVVCVASEGSLLDRVWGSDLPVWDFDTPCIYGPKEAAVPQSRQEQGDHVELALGIGQPSDQRLVHGRRESSHGRERHAFDLRLSFESGRTIGCLPENTGGWREGLPYREGGDRNCDESSECIGSLGASAASRSPRLALQDGSESVCKREASSATRLVGCPEVVRDLWHGVQTFQVAGDLFETGLPQVTPQPTCEESATADEDVVYCLDVDDNHNFFANGVLVHNCQEYTHAAWKKIRPAINEYRPNIGHGAMQKVFGVNSQGRMDIVFFELAFRHPVFKHHRYSIPSHYNPKYTVQRHAEMLADYGWSIESNDFKQTIRAMIGERSRGLINQRNYNLCCHLGDKVGLMKAPRPIRIDQATWAQCRENPELLFERHPLEPYQNETFRSVLSMDYGSSNPSEIGIWHEVVNPGDASEDNKMLWALWQRITLLGISGNSQAPIVDYLSDHYKLDALSIDSTASTDVVSQILTDPRHVSYAGKDYHKRLFPATSNSSMPIRYQEDEPENKAIAPSGMKWKKVELTGWGGWKLTVWALHQQSNVLSSQTVAELINKQITVYSRNDVEMDKELMSIVEKIKEGTHPTYTGMNGLHKFSMLRSFAQWWHQEYALKQQRRDLFGEDFEEEGNGEWSSGMVITSTVKVGMHRKDREIYA